MRGKVDRFTKLLEVLDMSPESAACPGLVRADEVTRAAKQREQAPLEEVVALERASDFSADYVYFRRFLERPPMAVAYIYDWTERLADSTERQQLADLHRRWWSASEIPLVFVFLPTEVQIYHVLQGPEVRASEIHANPLRTIALANHSAEALRTLKEYSARRLDDGTFWEEDGESRRLSQDGAAFMALSQEIGRCRARLVLECGFDDDLVRRLLILFVMIKYLEERVDRDGNGVFPRGAFSKFAPGAQCFVDLLRAGGRPTLLFLDYLATKDRFNGEVFQLDPKQRTAIENADLEHFASFLDARLEGRQYTFWRRYEFRELPVELISHLYEQFLPRQPGVVYTPPFLVAFILDEVLPLSGVTPAGFKLLDPACGSGVFLVGAFKRLVHRWRRDNDFRRPDASVLKALVSDHLFGVDVEPEAVRLTLFSLSVALCDFLEPRVIWEDLHFDSLQGRNLRPVDFFSYAREDAAAGAFDVVVGNPPFVSVLSQAAKAAAAEIRRRESDFELPDNQLALLFLKVATSVAKPEGDIALIQPAVPLLYGEGSARFRGPYFRSVNVTQIVDLTHLSRVLFKRSSIPSIVRDSRNAGNPGDVAVAVIFAANCPPQGQDLLHVTVRRTVQAEQKIVLEIDHYDLHSVRRADAVNEPRIWKANFVGGGRIIQFLRRLARIPTLGGYLTEMKKRRGWDYGEGYIAGKKENVERLSVLSNKQRLTLHEKAELAQLRKRHRQAPWLKGKKSIPTLAFKATGIEWSKLESIDQDWFTEPRRASLFQAPLLLVKCSVEKESEEIPVALVNESVRFRDRIYGIHAPKKDTRRLEVLYDVLADQRLPQFWVLSTSSEYLINRSTAFHSVDLLSLPFLPSEPDLALTEVENALMEDALQYVAAFKREGDRSSVLGEPSGEELDLFGAYFCRALGAMYSELRSGEPRRYASVVCYPFYFGAAPSVQLPEGEPGLGQFDALMSTPVGTSLRCQRIVRVFHGNMLFLVKPAQRRYWLRSIALRDADDIFAELRGRGL